MGIEPTKTGNPVCTSDSLGLALPHQFALGQDRSRTENVPSQQQGLTLTSYVSSNRSRVTIATVSRTVIRPERYPRLPTLTQPNLT